MRHALVMAASPRPVTEIQIGGNVYRVQSSADEAELARLVAIVDARLAELPHTQRNDSRSLVLVALSLAHDLERARRDYDDLRVDVVTRLTALVGRVDTALDHRDEKGELLPPVPTSTTAEASPSVAESDQPGVADPAETAAATSIVAKSDRAPASRRARPTPGRREVNDPH